MKTVQTNYSGPYKVVKKIGETITWSKLLGDIRKHKCVISICSKHIIKKAKPELVLLNNRLGLESPTHSEDCADPETKKDEDTESEVKLGNDQQPIKLQNLQILTDLGTKLSKE